MLAILAKMRATDVMAGAQSAAAQGALLLHQPPRASRASAVALAPPQLDRSLEKTRLQGLLEHQVVQASGTSSVYVFQKTVDLDLDRSLGL